MKCYTATKSLPRFVVGAPHGSVSTVVFEGLLAAIGNMYRVTLRNRSVRKNINIVTDHY